MKIKITSTSLITFFILSVVFMSCKKDDAEENNLNTQDKTFIMKVGMGNTAEVNAGTLASTKGEEAGIKAFGQQMAADHSTAQSELKAVGTNVNVNVPDSVDAEHAMLMETLQSLSGRAFDSAYIVNQITDHQKTIDAFKAEINSGSHIQVKDFANKFLPKIEMHLQHADSIATAMGVK